MLTTEFPVVAGSRRMNGTRGFPVAQLNAEALWRLQRVAADVTAEDSAALRAFVDLAIEHRRAIIQRQRRERTS